MSAFAADASQAQNPSLSHPDNSYGVGGGQNHDRIHGADDNMAGTNTGASSPADEVTITQRMTSATLGSVITSLLATPLDVVRIRLQSQQHSHSTSALRFSPYSTSFQKLPTDLGVTACCREVFWVGDNAPYCFAGPSQGDGRTAALNASDCAVEERQRRIFTSTLDGLRKIAKNEGPLTLWRGLSPTLVMAVPANVIYFTGYDWLRFSPTSPVNRVASDAYSPLIAGTVARMAAAVVVSPIEMFRTRMQAAHSSGTGLFRETLQGLHQMTKTQGYASLWRGLTLTMWRDVPFSGIYWWGYEAVRNIITDARIKAHSDTSSEPLVRTDVGLTQSSHQRRDSQLQTKPMTTFIDSFIAGSVSGATAALITTPFDVGKTRQQVSRHGNNEPKPATKVTGTSIPKKAPEQLSMPKFLYHILQTEGMSGLFKGWAARCLKVAPSCGIMISSYEIGKRWARIMNEHKEHKHEEAL